MNEIEEVRAELLELKLEVFAFAAAERKLMLKKEQAFKRIIKLREALQDLVGAPEDLLEEIEESFEELEE